MRQDLIDKYRDFFDKMITEMALVFGSNVKGYVAGKASIKKKEVVAERKKEVVHRYGINLTQNGENYTYTQLRKIEKLFQDKEEMDKFTSQREAKDIMCLYLLKEAFAIAHIPFESNYEKQINQRKRTFSIKMMGFIIFCIFALVVIAVLIIKLFSQYANKRNS